MKKKILLISILVLLIVGLVIGILFVIKSNKSEVKEPKIVHHEYGTSPGDMGYGCQGADNYYFIRWDSLDNGEFEMYAVSKDDEISIIDDGVHYLNYYDGYVYYGKSVGEVDYIYRLNESNGEKDIVLDPCQYLGENYKYVAVWNMRLVDRKIVFDMQYGHNKSDDWDYETFCYDCDSGTIEKTDKSEAYTSSHHSDLKDEMDAGKYKCDLSWIYPQGDLLDPNEQYYGEYLYGIAKTLDTEATEDWADCYYAPRDFCMIRTWDVMDGNAGDDLKKLDTQVTHFNVGYEYIYYAKAESGITSIWRRDLNGDNPVQIAIIEKDAWVIDIVAGENVMICAFSDWEYNRSLHSSEKVYEMYFVDINTGEVALLDEKINSK